MKTSLNLILVLGFATTMSSCMKQGESGLQLKAKFDSKPQIVDVLKGKTNSEVLSIKYTEVSANCQMSVRKESHITVAESLARVTAVVESTSPTPEPPVGPQPIFNSSESDFVYNIVAQAKVDPTLAQEVSTTLKISKNVQNDQNVTAEIKIAPAVFADLVNLDLGGSKYIMKHTPVLSYTYNYDIVQGEMKMKGSGVGAINEKVRTEKSFATYTNGNFSYNLVLSCELQTALNTSVPENQKEFESQWSCVGCAGTGPIDPLQ